MNDITMCEMQNKIDIANKKITELEDFISDLHAVPNIGCVTEIRGHLLNASKEKKLWCDLHLKKYPGNY